MKNIIYNEETQEFAKTILDFLKDKYGEVPEMFKHSIKILLTNYNIWTEAKNDIMSRGAMITDDKGCVKKNPAMKIFIDSQVYVINQLREFGLTPKALKSLNKNEEKEEKTSPEDLLEILNTL